MNLWLERIVEAARAHGHDWKQISKKPTKFLRVILLKGPPAYTWEAVTIQDVVFLFGHTMWHDEFPRPGDQPHALLSGSRILTTWPPGKHSRLPEMVFGFPSIHVRRWIKKAVHPLKGEYSSLSVWDTAKEHNRKKGGSRRLSQGAKKEQTIELRSKLGISSRTFTIPGGVPSMTAQRDCSICYMSPVLPLFKWEFFFF